MATVNIEVRRNPTEDPIIGVLVRFYQADGSVLTEALTDLEGNLSVLLPAGAATMRFYKLGYAFAQPQQILVVDPDPNTFVVRGTALTPSLSPDPRFCRCSGFFRELTGAPKAYLDLHITAEFNPLVLDGVGVVPGTVGVRTDERGGAQVDLLRGGKYRFFVESLGCERHVLIPDLPSANLPDILFAIVNRVTFEPSEVFVTGEAFAQVGVERSLRPSVITSSGVTLAGTAADDVIWSVDNRDVVSLRVKEEELVLTGVAPGVTWLRAVRKDNSIVRAPQGDISGQPIRVTVA